MSKETSESVKREVVRLFYSGQSYDDISHRLGIGKATVFAIINDLRNGELTWSDDLQELVGDMRDLSVSLRKAEITPVEAIGLFIMSKRLLELVEPAQVDYWVKLCKSIPHEEKFAASQVVQAALRLTELEVEQGLSYDDTIRKYNSLTSELTELGEKVRVSRIELTKMEEGKTAAVEACRGLEAEKSRFETANAELTAQAQELSSRCTELKKSAADLQDAVSVLEEKGRSLRDSVPNLEGRVEQIEAEITERATTLKTLADVGFSREQLDQLRIRLVEMMVRYGLDGLTDRFLQNLANYDLCLGLEATTTSLRVEVAKLTQTKESLIQFAKKMKLSMEEIGEGIISVNTLQKKGVSPAHIVSYDRLLTSVGLNPESFEKLVMDFGSLEKMLDSKRHEIGAIEKEIEEKTKLLEQMEEQEKGIKAYLAFLKEQTAKEIKDIAGVAKGEVSKFSQEMRHDIEAWGTVRSELGRCQNELKLARYFGAVPVSEQGLLNLARDMDVAIVAQILLLSRTWSKLKFNPKQKPPPTITGKYVGIADYTKVELADVITWALQMVAEGS